MFTIAADDEMRKLVKEEIRGQVVALTREEIEKEVAEGFRRAKGNAQNLDKLIEQIATRIIEKHVALHLQSFNPETYGRQLVREKVDAWVEEKVHDLQNSIVERAKKAIDDFDYKGFVTKALKNFKISL